MAHEVRTLAAAQEIETELERRCAALAPVLASPAHARDPDVVRALWNEINELRPALSDVLQQMRQRGGTPKERKRHKNSAEWRAYRGTRKAVQERLKAWSDVSDMVARHIHEEPVRLIPKEIPPIGDPLLEFLAATLHRVSSPSEQSDDGFTHGAYADIAMPPLKFEALIHAAYRLALARGEPSQMRFADIGCGGGVKLVMARRFFGKCTGVEYDAAYVRDGQEFLAKVGLKDIEIEQGDALTYEDYGKFDLIYFYRPMRSDEALEQMEQRIVDQAKPGTLVLAPYDHFLKPRRVSGFARISSSLDTCSELVPPIYATGITQEEADLWRRDAELTDTRRIPDARTYGFKPGFWTPLLEASRYGLYS